MPYLTGEKTIGIFIEDKNGIKRYDIGNPYLRLTANIEFALKRDDLREDILEFLKSLK